LSAAKNIFQEKGIEHVGNSYHSLNEKEFSGYLTNAIAAKPDVLLLLNFGAQSSDTAPGGELRHEQEHDHPDGLGVGLEQFDELGADLCEGVYFGAQYWHTADTRSTSDLVKRTPTSFKIVPNYSLAGSYICTKILLDGIVKAGTVDQKAVVAALEGMKYDGLTGAGRNPQGRPPGHQGLLPAQGQGQVEDENPADYVDVVSSGKSFLPLDKTGCKLA
jgi:branched-chain amino acid transport system substrate-binding protein